MEDNLNQLNEMLKSLGKKLGKKSAKHILKLLGPFLPYIAIVVLVVFFVLMLVAATYSSMPSATTLTGVNPSPRDAKLEQEYATQANYYGNINTWQIGGLVTPGDETTGEPVKSGFYQPGANYAREGFKNLYSAPKSTPVGDKDVQMVPDKYGYVAVQALTWGFLESTNLYITYNFNKATVDETNIKPLAVAMQPYFFYKESEVITRYWVKTKKGWKRITDIQDVRLLTEAYTVYGHHEYFYKWVTTRTGKGYGEVTQIKEEPAKSVWLPSDYFLNTFNKYFHQTYESSSPDYQQAKDAIFQGGQGFTQEIEWMNWLQNLATGGTQIITAPGKDFPYTQNILQYESYIDQYAQEYNIPPALVAAIMAQESGGNPDAVSTAGALGLMQLTPDKFTAEELASGEWEDPNLNIQMGVAYIRYVAAVLGYGQDFWNDPTQFQNVIAGYNAGPGAVEEYGGIPPYPETEEYVPDVLAFYSQFQGLINPGTRPGT